MSHPQRRKPTGWIQRFQQAPPPGPVVPGPAEPAAHSPALDPNRVEATGQSLPDTLPAAQVAAAFGIDRRTLTNWEAAGVLIPIRIRTRKYYLVAHVTALLGVRGQ